MTTMRQSLTRRRPADASRSLADIPAVTRASHELRHHIAQLLDDGPKDGLRTPFASTSAGVEGRSGREGIRRRLGEAAFHVFASRLVREPLAVAAIFLVGPSRRSWDPSGNASAPGASNSVSASFAS